MASTASPALNRLIPSFSQPRNSSAWHASESSTTVEAETSVEADTASEPVQSWTAWRKHLSQRNRPVPLAAVLVPRSGRLTSCPLSWGLPISRFDGTSHTKAGRAEADGHESARHSFDAENLAQVLQFGAGAGKRRISTAALVAFLSRWLAEADGAAIDPSLAIEALGWSYALARLASRIEAPLWWALFDQLMAIAAGDEPAADSRDYLARQLALGELPLTLAYLFPEIKPCRLLGERGAGVVASVIADDLAAEGMPRYGRLDWIRSLLASALRCRAILTELPTRQDCIPQDWYERLLKQALLLSRATGEEVFAAESDRRPPAALRATREMFATALRFSVDPENRRLAAAIFDISPKTSSGRRAFARGCGPSMHSEPARLALLGSKDLSGDFERLAVDYGGNGCRLELIRGNDTLFSGSVGATLEVDGHALQPTSPWEQSCWISDKDVDYLELSMSLVGGITVERHLLLARREHFCLAADAVLLEQPRKLTYQMSWPLGTSMRFCPAMDTHEAFITTARRRALVLPLALPEWRSDPRADTLEERERCLLLSQSTAHASALFVPLFIDLGIRGTSRGATWRQLTVAEDRVIQPADVAVGYRCQVGQRQWLIYRSLGPGGNRTVLGHNLVSQFMVARFKDGKAQPLLEIE